MELTPDTATHEMTLLLAEATQYLADAFARLGKQEGEATECADAAIKSTRRVEHVYRLSDVGIARGRRPSRSHGTA